MFGFGDVGNIFFEIYRFLLVFQNGFMDLIVEFWFVVLQDIVEQFFCQGFWSRVDEIGKVGVYENDVVVFIGCIDYSWDGVDYLGQCFLVVVDQFLLRVFVDVQLLFESLSVVFDLLLLVLQFEEVVCMGNEFIMVNR